MDVWHLLWSKQVYEEVFQHWAQDAEAPVLRLIAQIAETLVRDPENLGESRAEGRVAIIGKAAVYFEINSFHRVVRVSHVHIRGT